MFSLHVHEMYKGVIHARLFSIWRKDAHRSEEHTSELQSQSNLVCRLLLEKKKKAILLKSVTILIVQFVRETDVGMVTNSSGIVVFAITAVRIATISLPSGTLSEECATMLT